MSEFLDVEAEASDADSTVELSEDEESDSFINDGSVGYESDEDDGYETPPPGPLFRTIPGAPCDEPLHYHHDGCPECGHVIPGAPERKRKRVPEESDEESDSDCGHHDHNNPKGCPECGLNVPPTQPMARYFAPPPVEGSIIEAVEGLFMFTNGKFVPYVELDQ